MNSSHLFGRATAWIVDTPWLAYVLIVVMSTITIIGYVDHRIITKFFQKSAETTEEDEEKPRSSSSNASRPDVEEIDLGKAHAVLVVQSDDIFTPQGAEALRDMASSLEELPYVANVLWIDRVPLLNAFGLPEPVLPKSTASPGLFAAAKARALKHPLISGQLMSPDGKTVLFMVTFDFLFVDHDEDCSERLREVAEAAAKRHPETKFSVLVTGRVPIHLTMLRTHEENERKYQIIGYGVVLLMAIVLFRGISSVLIVVLGPSLGIFWTLGCLKFFELRDNPFNDVVLPVMLSLVGLTDGVHLMVQIRRYRAHGMNTRDATRAALKDVGQACFLTSLTTAIGFWSLSLARHEVVQTFGWSCVLGVTLTFAAVMLAIPLACVSWLGRWVPPTDQKGFIERHLHRISGLIDWVLKTPRVFSTLGIAMTIIFTIISLTLRPDERRSSYLPADTEAVQGMEVMDRALGGLEFAKVEVHWSEKIAADSAEVLQVITQIDEFLRAEPLLGTPISIRSLVEALPGEGPPEERMTLLELLPASLKRAFYTPESRVASIDFRVQDLGIAKYGDVFQRIESQLNQLAEQHPEFQIKLAGSAVWRWRNLYQIVVDLASSLGSAAIIIFVVLGFAYQSLRMGLIAVVPNVFPLAVTGTYLVLTGQSLEVVSVCAFTICLGIAVDDTIHFLTRYLEELPRCATEEDAIRKAFTGVGTSLIMTTMVLVIGFATVMTSDMRDQRIFATMGAITLSAALLGDLIILPAMLACYGKSQQKK